MAKAQSGTRPRFRTLRVYAFDPLLSTRIETEAINEVGLNVPWEGDGGLQAELQPGPVGEYLEVVDYDPSSQCFYEPVDLNDPYLLAQDGLAPSEGNPQFHQQMVYAVAMTTIRNFERALGRCVLWSPRITGNGRIKDGSVRRLRVYPHALREANAFYSPRKKALLFGYIRVAASEVGDNLPGGVVFACLSHDIIAHETAHAVIDGLHRRFLEPSNVDVLAFHEALADIVALFQHFSLPGVLTDQIAKTRGDLASQNLLAKLAQQFGQAIGRRGALRDALGSIDQKTKQWRPTEPDPTKIQTTIEPHARGAILVAAVFDAFLTIYKARIADLLRIATGGTGVLPAGAIHPDLVARLVKEARKAAGHVLTICIRALDYCPPVDVNFGDFLRALITADTDVAAADERGYRIAFVEAFRRWGIYPLDVRSLSVDSLLWHHPSDLETQWYEQLTAGKRSFRELSTDWKMWSDREHVYQEAKANARKVHGWLTSANVRKWLSGSRAKKLEKKLGLALGKGAPRTVFRGRDGWPLVEVHSVRPAVRLDLDGQPVTDMVIEITQRRRGYLDADVQRKADQSGGGQPPRADFIFRGGCTLLVNLETDTLRYIVYKRIASEHRLQRQREILSGQFHPSLRVEDVQEAMAKQGEPFAMLHRAPHDEGENQWLEP